MSTTSPGLRRVLEADHSYLDELLASVAEASRRNEAHALGAAWGAFERHLLTHLDNEEMLLLPLVQVEHAAEVEWLRADHNAIRRELGELDLAIDLHTLRVEEIERLATRLRDHAARERAWLYPWADRSLDETRTSHLVRRLRAAWKRSGHVMRHLSDDAG